MHGVTVFRDVDRDAAHAELVGCAKGTNGDLAAIRDE
jgi:hypothetical protein